MIPVEERIDHEEARKRLTLWFEDAGMHARYHRPYANPAELRADVRALLTEHSALVKAARAHYEHTRDYCFEELDHACPTWESLGRALPATESAQPEEEPDD